MTMVHRLVIRGDDGAERVVELHEGVIRIGRSADNEIVLADADKGVSRAHAELHIEGGRCTIIDLHSQNGTWLNGLRVQRAEVRPDAEIAIGLYRLTLQPVASTAADDRANAPSTAVLDTLVSPASRPGRNAAGKAAGADLPLSRAAGAPSNRGLPTQLLDKPVDGHAAAASRAPARSRTPLVVGSMIAIAVVALLVGRFVIPKSSSAVAVAPPASPTATSPAAVAVPPASPQPRSGEAPGAASEPAPAAVPAPSPQTTAGSTATPPTSKPPTGRAPVRNAARGSAAAAQEAARAYTSPMPVTRKPGESVEEWRERSAALQARYAYSKVALDRGDFAAAAGGFAAILNDEPGFLDAPQLLVRAREGLRGAALAALESGNRLDAAGDWTSALRKYDQAREIDRAVPGLESAITRVREKMRVAGADALTRARQHDAAGRAAEALHEYEKAAQWLPVEDPNRDVARARADQLRVKPR